MKKIARMYNSEFERNIVKLTSRRDKLGNLFHVVDYSNADGVSSYACFERLESAMDFIYSNFRAKL